MIVIILIFAIAAYYGSRAYINYEYPVKYTELVEKYSAQYDVEEELIYAVIKTESGFDPNAVSEVGARGLMQMTEETFDWVHTKIQDDATFEDLYNPEVSIHYGTYLLNYLLEEFSEDQDTAMSAYHAGIASVKSWLAIDSNSSDGRTLDNIPKADTAHYVHKINNAYDMYQKILEEEAEKVSS